jgi:hypothetical protein
MAFSGVLGLFTLLTSAGARAAGETSQEANRQAIAERLQRAYPDFVAGISDNEVLFADGTTLPFDDGIANKSPMDWITTPDIEDMFAYPYPAGSPALVPELNVDPGRARNTAFFSKIYGDCRKGETEKHLVKIVWLPKKFGRSVMITSVNGAAEHLRAVSEELDALPKSYNIDLFPIAGTYNCRSVAGVKAPSAHGYGIAIDISLRRTSYWRWFMVKPTSPITYKNRLPIEIVRIFEKHGFIWGGRWYHYDTMHFEYRPELLPQ